MNNLPEIWKPLVLEDNIDEREVYLISNHGRIKSLKADKEKGFLMKTSYTNGYPFISLTQKSGKRTGRYIHKLVAQTFIKKDSEDQKFVIHLDFDKENNVESNLAWATKTQRFDHLRINPNFKNTVKNSKLTAGRVKMIKKKLLDPNRKTRMKMLAKQFGVSEMQLHRIKTGENWGYIKVD